MPRAVWTGSLSFGLVNVGVRLFPATSPKDVRFHLVDERGQRVRFRRFGPDEPAEPDGLSALTVVQLREKARAAGRTGFSRMTKAQLVELLS